MLLLGSQLGRSCPDLLNIRLLSHDATFQEEEEKKGGDGGDFTAHSGRRTPSRSCYWCYMLHEPAALCFFTERHKQFLTKLSETVKMFQHKLLISVSVCFSKTQKRTGSQTRNYYDVKLSCDQGVYLYLYCWGKPVLCVNIFIWPKLSPGILFCRTTTDIIHQLIHYSINQSLSVQRQIIITVIRRQFLKLLTSVGLLRLIKFCSINRNPASRQNKKSYLNLP